jgi:hypothetical protein
MPCLWSDATARLGGTMRPLTGRLGGGALHGPAAIDALKKRHLVDSIPPRHGHGIFTFENVGFILLLKDSR